MRHQPIVCAIQDVSKYLPVFTNFVSTVPHLLLGPEERGCFHCVIRQTADKNCLGDLWVVTILVLDVDNGRLLRAMGIGMDTT